MLPRGRTKEETMAIRSFNFRQNIKMYNEFNN